VKRPISALTLAAVLALVPGGASGQDARAAKRAVAKQWQGAIESMDDTVEAVATVIDPGGLTVMSLSSLDPGAMISRLMGAASGDEKMQIVSEPSDVRIRLADGRELPARIVLRDQDLDLAFIRPTAKPTAPLTAINLADDARPQLLDDVVV
jgi:hypothetical protein